MKTPNARQRASAQRPMKSSATTWSGVVVDLDDDTWSYRDGLRTVFLNFSPMATLLGPKLMSSYRSTMAWYLENTSAASVSNLHVRFLHFLRFLGRSCQTPLESLGAQHVLNYRASLSRSTSWYLAHVAVLLRRWNDLGYHGATEAVALLAELRISGNSKGAAVMTMDPIDGPFSTVELEALQAAVDLAHRSGKLSEGQCVLAWLFMALGQRPVQYAAMKVVDVLVAPGVGERCSLRVPRAKQRKSLPRAEFKERPLNAVVGRMLISHARAVEASFVGKLSDPTQAPLFPVARTPCRPTAPGFEYHQTSGGLADSLSTALQRLNVFSERTGKALHITAQRFRRTFGTRAAQEGLGELVIAELLDHSDTQSVGMYVGLVPEIAERIDRAVAMHLAPLAQAFKGRLIGSEVDASIGGEASRIIDLRVDRSARPMGSCGQQAECRFAAPIACYTCPSFEPWLDGPHEAVLNHLLERRERLLATDPRLAETSDRTILAVAEVIQRIELWRQGCDA